MQKHGMPVSAFQIVLEGAISVKNSITEQVWKGGSWIGEMGLLTGEPANYNAVVKTAKVVVGYVEKSDFLRFLGDEVSVKVDAPFLVLISSFVPIRREELGRDAID